MNQNGVRDASDGGRGGLIVFNDSNNNGSVDLDEVRTTTNTAGEYSLLVPGGDPYQLRILPGQGFASTDGGTNTGTVSFGRSVSGVNFGTEFVGTSFHNGQVAEDVDAVNGVTPLDALIVINELTNRNFSDPQTGDLDDLTDPLSTPVFVDVNDDGMVAPLDALLVINFLNNAPPAAALSSSADGDSFGFVPAGNDRQVVSFEADNSGDDKSDEEQEAESLIDQALANLGNGTF